MKQNQSAEDPDLVRSLSEQLRLKKDEMDNAIREYCELLAAYRLQERVSNGLYSPQEQFAKPTIRLVIIQCIKQRSGGASMTEIRGHLKRFGLTPSSETISSTLNRLKNDDIITKSPLRSKYWILSELSGHERR